MFPYNRYFILIVTTIFLAFSLAVTASHRIVGNRIDTNCSREVGEDPDGVRY